MSDLLERWESLLEVGRSAQHLASPSHPLRIYVGATAIGAPEFLVQYPKRPKPPDLGSFVRVNVSYRQRTGDWLMAITLEDMDLRQQFVRVASDVIEDSGQEPTAAAAYTAFERALERWKRLLRTRASFGEEAVRGLIGELWIARQLIQAGYPANTVAVGWKRSPTSPQDIYLPDGRRIEVKSVRPGGREIRITSAEQLDWADGDIELVTVELLEAPEGDEGITLNGMIEKWAAEVDPGHKAILLSTLAERGYLHEHPLSDAPFVVSAVKDYAVTQGFPCIRTADVPQAVSRLEYGLLLSSIRPFLRETNPPEEQA